MTFKAQAEACLITKTATPSAREHPQQLSLPLHSRFLRAATAAASGPGEWLAVTYRANMHHAGATGRGQRKEGVGRFERLTRNVRYRGMISYRQDQTTFCRVDLGTCLTGNRAN